MKVIDLLNKIANGEEVPKKIKIKQWENNWEDKNLEYELYSRLYEEDFELNDEVEILKEEKEIPEKITTQDFLDLDTGYLLKKLVDNQNQLIDYLKSKGDE